jgi:nucleotide-binding universal stress UspA family protein
MYDHVIVGLDFSPGGDVLLESVAALRSFGTRRVTLVHATEGDPALAGVARHLEDQRARLEEARVRVEQMGFEVGTELIAGDPGQAIRNTARDLGASLVMVGSRSHNRLDDAFVGSVAWDVVHRTTLPVLVQRIAPTAEGAALSRALKAITSFDRILFPTDWSETAGHALEHVEALARQGTIPSIVLLHVRSQLDETRSGRSTESEDLARLEEIAGRLRRSGPAQVRVDAPSGAPFVEIVRRSGESPGTLVVMGTHGRGLVADALIGSVSREVVRRAEGAILLIPSKHASR